MRTRFAITLGAAALTALMAACGGSVSGPAAAVATATAAASVTPSPLSTPVPAASPPVATPAPATPVPAPPAVVATASTSLGTVLVEAAHGMTLYMFGSDIAGSGSSRCNGGCASTWPALTVAAGTTPTGSAGVTGPLATITRGDGRIQVTYGGRPLYMYSGDSAAGQTNGNYPGWSVSRP